MVGEYGAGQGGDGMIYPDVGYRIAFNINRKSTQID